MELEGKWALVTGAARRVGKEIAKCLAAAGANVVVHYGASGAAAERTVDELRSAGVSAWPIGADLANPSEIDTLFAEVENRCRGLSVLVNSAASFERRALGDISADDWNEVLAVNLRAPFLCVQRAARLMAGQRAGAGERGAIVNIADLSGLQAWKGYAHHGVSKAGLVHLTKVAAKELAPDIRVNCVVPGAILPPPGMSTDDPEWHAKIARIPLRRAGAPALVAQTVLFLIHNPFVTGAVVPVDGGEHLAGAQPVTE